MYNIDNFYTRLAQLRLRKGISARDMSLSLGQSESYINKIENHRTLPSLTGFLYICDYFDITPQEFFSEETDDPHRSREFLQEFEKLSPEQAEHIMLLIRDLTRRT